MSRTAMNRRRFLRLAVLLALAPTNIPATPLCNQSPYDLSDRNCNIAPKLFDSPRLQPSGAELFPTVHGVALAVPHMGDPGQAGSNRRSRLGRVGIYGLLALLAGAAMAAGVWTMRPYLRALNQPGCRNCGSCDIRISFRSGFIDWVFALFSCEPYRCKVCYYRFHKIVAPGRAKLVSHGSETSDS